MSSQTRWCWVERSALPNLRRCPFEVVSSSIKVNGKYIREIFFCNNVGQLQAITKEYINAQGDLMMEVRMNSQRNLYGTIEYEYDAAGELSIVRERTPDGIIISEVDYND